MGLQALGLQNNQHLKNSLISCDDPLKAISDFQEENSIHLPTLKPALNLLDLHGLKRLDFHLSIADELKEHLIKRVEELASSIAKDHSSEDLKKLEDLLDKSFPLINMPRLTNLILLIMKNLPRINETYLNYIKENEQLYAITPIEVKRQIWCFNSEVFYKELQPLFDKFTNYFDEIMTSFEMISPPAASTPAQINIEAAIIRDNLLLTNTVHSTVLKANKRISQITSDIFKLIGNNSKLYHSTLNKLTQLYLKTRNWFYSTLRSQLSIKLNELHNHDLINSIVTTGPGDTQNENVYKFASLINMCLKEKRIDTKRAKEIETIIDSKKFDKIIADAAFILADPFVVDMLARNAISYLNRCVQNELLPRNCTELIFVLRLLYLSLFSFDVINTPGYKEQKMDSILITEYLPNLAYFITDYYEKLYDDSLEALNTTTATPSTPSLLTTSPILGTTHTSPIVTGPASSAASTALASTKTSPPIVLKISTRKLEIISSLKIKIVENELCSVLYLYLVIACIEINDWVNLRVLLPAVRYPENNTLFFEKWFLYQFFHMVTDKSVIDQFKHDWFVTLVFDEFLFVLLQQKDAQAATNPAILNSSNMLYEQIYRLIEKLYPNHLFVSNFARFIEVIKPKKINSSSVHITYLKLKSKLDSNASNDPDDSEKL